MSLVYITHYKIFAAHFHEDSGIVETPRSKKIKVRFAALVTKTCRKLENKIKPEDLNTFLEHLHIPESPSVNEAFKAIAHRRLWNYLNFHPFKQFVELFAGDDQEIKSWFKTYKQHLKSYKESTKLSTGVDTDSSDESISGVEQEEQHVQCEYLEEDERCRQQEQFGQPARYDPHDFQELLIHKQ